MYVVDRSIHKLFLKVEGLRSLGVRHKKTSALPPLPPLPLRRARTSADLRGAQNIGREDVVFVLNCRDLDKSNSAMYVVK